MNIKYELTDKVRALLIKKGVISWGAGMREEVEATAQMLQQINNSGQLIFKQRPDRLFSLIHVSLGYGCRPVVLGKHTDILLGARIRNGVPCYSSMEDMPKIKNRLSKLGVNVPIKVM
jgi:hypothetical protein